MSIAEKLTAVAENVQKVHDSGYEKGYRYGYEVGNDEGHASGYTDGWDVGYGEGHTNGYAEGKTAEYDAFWDSFKDIKDYAYVFAGEMWNDVTFKPKHSIICSALNVNNMFYNNACSNIKKTLNDYGVVLDLSKAVSVSTLFSYSSSEELPEIDVSSASVISGIFSNMSNLVTIDKVTFKEGVSFKNAFANTTRLENITIGGTISGSDFDIHWSTKLTAASLASIINALSAETSGLTVTMPTTAQSNYDAVYGDGAWAQLVATKSNWTIEYA